MKEKIYLSSPHMCGKEKKFIDEAFRTNWIAPLGPNVTAFEEEIVRYTGSKAAAALSSGTAAIHLALILLGIKEGDIVFCSDLTFSATCNPILYQHATPVFIDSESKSWNMSPQALQKAFLKHRPKAVIVVNLYGQSADMNPILELCQHYEVPLIEDAAESLGATYHGKKSGTFGKFGIYSFNGNKIITTSGGGMLVSSDEGAIERARFFSTQSRDKARYYQHSQIGYNYRMSNICAGIGRGQLTVLEERIEKKKEIFENYERAFSDIEDIEMAPICSYGASNYWLSCIILKEQSKVSPLEIVIALENENIESRLIWKPMHLQPIFQGYSFYAHEGVSPSVSEDIFNRGVCLPSDTKMTESDLQRVIDIISALWI